MKIARGRERQRRCNKANEQANQRARKEPPSIGKLETNCNTNNAAENRNTDEGCNDQRNWNRFMRPSQRNEQHDRGGFGLQKKQGPQGKLRRRSLPRAIFGKWFLHDYLRLGGSSPSFRCASFFNILESVDSLKNRTAPSAKAKLSPAPCMAPMPPTYVAGETPFGTAN